MLGLDKSGIVDPSRSLTAEFWRRAGIELKPDATRTVLKPFRPAYPGEADGAAERTRAIIDRMLSLDSRTRDIGQQYMTDLLDDRHRDIEATLLRRFDEIKPDLPGGKRFLKRDKLLIGGLFSEEYAFEAAALFNPSVVRHWDQRGLKKGEVRFILSLRGIGEGHVSSVTFRTGVWNGKRRVQVDKPSRFAEPPIVDKLEEEGGVLCLRFESAQDLSEAVLFPMTSFQTRGLEDLRLVIFTEEDGSSRYVGLFTAFDGREIRSEILTTQDFSCFEMRPLTGRAVKNKGMALFPRRIGGRYAMIGRQDNESIWLMTSDDLYRWDKAKKIVEPLYPWELVQMGNCGSPIEIDEGWLLFTHAIGVVRNYTMGAVLLDKKDPSKVLARSNIPLLRSGPEQRDGYVPNVVYSCGALIEGRRILLPYGVADNFTSMVTGDLDAMLAHMS